jgi:hypothetical protein
MTYTLRMSPAQRFSRTVLLLATLLAPVIATAACGSSSSPQTALATNQQILSTCDPSAPPASLVAIDGTGSSAATAIEAERMTVVESVVRRTAICSGDLRVTVFTTSSAAGVTLFDGALKLPGATNNARLLRAPNVVASVMAQIKKTYAPAAAGLQYGGSDITGQYRQAADWITQVGRPYLLHFYLLTDGFQTIGVDLGAHVLSPQQAAALADQITMPRLPGASIIVAGLGRIAGPAAATDVVDELVSYYNQLCHNAAAASCLSVTDYAGDGR